MILNYGLEKNKIEVNESCLLNLIISGYGNLNLLTAPQLKLSNNKFLSQNQTIKLSLTQEEFWNKN